MQDGTFKGRCHKECRINADCGGIQFCENNICIGKCDPAKGVSTNSGCPLTHYCPLETPAGAQAGYCVKRPARRGINTQTPRTCEQDNDCTNSQICVERTCLEKCFPPPLQKVQANTACPSNTTCVAALTTEQMNEYGGTCVPSPRQNDGQVCNRTDKLCVQNNTLFCGGVCYKRCDPKHPNPCGGLATCTQYRGVHVCFKNCFVNAVCPFGARCQKSTGAPTRTGICLPSAQAKRLPGAISQIGTACTNQTYNTSCDDNASLYCRYEARNQRTCSKMCDPRNTLPVGSYKCPTGQTCKEDYANSFFGGYCN
jgi:hypothetical protein